MPSVKQRYRTASRPKGATAAGVNPRKGEDRNRGGQKTYEGDPDGMKATEPAIRKSAAIERHKAKRRTKS